MMSHDTKAPANTQMHPAPMGKPPEGGVMHPAPTANREDADERLKPTLLPGTLPVYLAKVHPEAAEAALAAGEKAVEAAPAYPRDVANVDLPREGSTARTEPHHGAVPVQPQHPPKDK
jgi:hypothetical protein